MKVSAQEKITRIFDFCDVVILYDPIKDEVSNLVELLPILKQKQLYLLPSNRKVDPVWHAKELIYKYDSKKICLFIPGTAFDTYGTRHGRGGGWFDRFLSSVPCPWIRIGVAKAKDFSGKKLERKAWDEPVDYVFVINDVFSCEVIECEPARSCK